MATDGSAPAVSDVLDISYDAGASCGRLSYVSNSAAVCRQICKWVARVVWCVMWRVEGVSPYVGIPIGGIGWIYSIWRASDWRKNDLK